MAAKVMNIHLAIRVCSFSLSMVLQSLRYEYLEDI